MSVLRRSVRPSLGSSVLVHPKPARVPLKYVVALWLLRRLGRLLVWLVKHPVTCAALAACAGMWWLVAWALAELGPGATAAAAGFVVGLLGLWALLSPGTFDRLLETPVRSRWRKVSRYRREWQPAMVCSGLAIDGGRLLPTLLRVRSSAVVDVVRVHMLPGQTVEDWQKAAPRLAQTFGVPEVRAQQVRGNVQHLDLWCLTGDPLAAPVPVPEPIATAAGLQAVPVGAREDGTPFRLRLLHSHLLVAGVTGAGKGSVIWSLLVGVVPAIRAGLVKVWAVDPKGGMELAAGAPLFDRFCHGDPEQVAELLDAAVAGLRARADRLRGKTRKLTPTRRDPLVLIVIDEVASLTSYVSDAQLRRRITNALAVLLSQGRAVGVTVVAATQDARKETLSMRDLFPNRVALRAAEPEQADMVLGRGARDRGARADKISEATPGVGYVVVDDQPQPVRVRFAHVTDDHIDRLVATELALRADEEVAA